MGSWCRRPSNHPGWRCARAQPSEASVYYRGDSSEALDDALNAVVDGSVEDTIAVETSWLPIDFQSGAGT